MMTRRQAKSFKAEDQGVLTNERFAFEVVGTKPDGEFVQLTIRPVPCGSDCLVECDCLYRMLADKDDVFVVRVRGSRRLPFMGNVRQAEAELKALQQQVESLRFARQNQSRVQDSNGDGNGQA